MHRVRGFTLIEVLVVVAIIALLISILLPSLAAARRQAKRTVCAVNLRTTGSAVYYYTEANRDFYPAHANWAEKCYSYIQRLGGTKPPPGNWADKYYEESPEFLLCPGDTKPHESTWNRTRGTTRYKTRVTMSYGINGFLTNLDPTGSEKPVKTRKTSEVRMPMEVVLLTDTSNDDIARVEEIDWRYEGLGQPGGFLEIHHGKGNNFLYADQHVTYHKVLGRPLENGIQNYRELMNGRGVPSFPGHWDPRTAN